MTRRTFTLRDLFWLVLMVAMGCAWYVDREQIRDQWSADSAATLRFIMEEMEDSVKHRKQLQALYEQGVITEPPYERVSVVACTERDIRPPSFVLVFGRDLTLLTVWSGWLVVIAGSFGLCRLWYGRPSH